MRFFRFGNHAPSPRFIILKRNNRVVVGSNASRELHSKRPQNSLSILSFYNSRSSGRQSTRSGCMACVAQKSRADIPIYFESICILQGYHKMRGSGNRKQISSKKLLGASVKNRKLKLAYFHGLNSKFVPLLLFKKESFSALFYYPGTLFDTLYERRTQLKAIA